MDTLLLRCRTVFVMTLFTCFLSLTGCASMLSNDGAKKEWLFVHTAEDAQVKSSAVIVMTAERDIFAFTDRPNREHMYLTPEEYVSLWNDNGSADNFFTDPPNAVLTWITPSGSVNESEIIITGATFTTNEISYTFKALGGVEIHNQGTLTNTSLFVDSNHDIRHAGQEICKYPGAFGPGTCECVRYPCIVQNQEDRLRSCNKILDKHKRAACRRKAF